METAKWLVFDTNVYIAATQRGVFSLPFRTLQAGLPRTHLASVVAAELLAGATSQPPRRAVHDFIRRAHKVHRVVTPGASTWERAGDLLGEIHRKEPHLRSKIPTHPLERPAHRPVCKPGGGHGGHARRAGHRIAPPLPSF